jgi:hypothetical protein
VVGRHPARWKGGLPLPATSRPLGGRDAPRQNVPPAGRPPARWNGWTPRTGGMPLARTSGDLPPVGTAGRPERPARWAGGRSLGRPPARWNGGMLATFAKRPLRRGFSSPRRPPARWVGGNPHPAHSLGGRPPFFEIFQTGTPFSNFNFFLTHF